MIIYEEDIGDTVLCDMCSVDFTERDDIGGLLFNNKAVCPICQPSFMVDVRKHKEEKFIQATCPELQSFHDWVITIRNGNNKITVNTL